MAIWRAGGRESWSGRSVLVTGGSAGIGRGIASAFLRAGAHVAIAGRSEAAGEAAAEALSREGPGRILFIKADVSRPGDCADLVKVAAQRLGGLDALINNAGQFASTPLLGVAPDAATNMFATNVLGPLFCAQAFARWAIANRRRGAIVNIGSIAGTRRPPGLAVYSASKAALNSLTETMAVEWTSQGVRVNGVAPGHVDTEAIRADFAAGRADEAAMRADIPAGRIADVADVARLVLFLASDQASHIVGQTIAIDGGEQL